MSSRPTDPKLPEYARFANEEIQRLNRVIADQTEHVIKFHRERNALLEAAKVVLRHWTYRHDYTLEQCEEGMDALEAAINQAEGDA